MHTWLSGTPPKAAPRVIAPWTAPSASQRSAPGATPLATASVLLILLLSGPADAQSLDQQTGSAACLALAGACEGLQDPTALWHNPAQLVSSPTRFTLSLHLLSREQAVHRTGTIVNQRPPEVRDIAGTQVTPALAVALPLWGRRLWGAVGYHQGLLIDSQYPAQETALAAGKDRESPGRYRGTRLQLQQHVVSVGLALKIKTFAMGAALELSHVTLLHQQSGWVGFTEDQDLLEDPELDMETRISGRNTLAVGGRFGAWWAPHPWLSVSASCSLPLKIRIEGETSIKTGTHPPFGTTSIGAVDGAARTTLPLPLRVRGGLALGPARLKLYLEGAFAAWSTADDLSVTAEGAALTMGSMGSDIPLVVPLPQIPLSVSLRDQVSFHGGLALQPWRELLTLRLGYSYHRGATAPSAPSSTVMDLTRHTLGLGLFVRQRGLRMGVAFCKIFEATLDAPGDQALLFNPLDAAVTGAVGAGQYRTSSVQVLLEGGYGW